MNHCEFCGGEIGEDERTVLCCGNSYHAVCHDNGHQEHHPDGDDCGQ